MAKALHQKPLFLTLIQDSNSDVEGDTMSSSELLADLNTEFHDRALLANQKRFYKRSGRDEESLSSEDEGVTKVKAFMAIANDEPVTGKADARSGQWVEITIKKRKNLLSKFNSLKQELSSCKSELIDLKNTKAHNFFLQSEITRLNLDNEYRRDEVFDLKKVIEK
ncbi:hypothetical protein Tco_1106265 [Tanacetum coccineum]